MAAMLTGGQKLGLLSTTNLTNVTPLTSATPGASINDKYNVHIHEDGLKDGASHSSIGGGLSGASPSNKKTVVFAKLTDSAFNAIADYVKKRVSMKECC